MKAVKRLSVLLAVLLVVTLAVGFSVSAADADVTTIENEEQLLAFVNGLNAGTVPANTNASLKADIALTDGMPMVTPAYKGTFDGEGHTISGINNTMFKELQGTVKNVSFDGTIDYSEKTDIRWAATVALEAKNGTAVLENVSSTVDIISTSQNVNAGGLVGYAKHNFTAKNCEYAGTYTLNWTSTNAGFAGIVGWINTSNSVVLIEDCVFSGELVLNVTSAGTMYLGGIVGHAGSSATGATVKNCVNTGTITVNDTESLNIWIGGIVAKFNNNNKHVIEGCVNDGEYVVPEMISVSGILGLNEDDKAAGSTIRDCVSLNDSGLLFDGTHEPTVTNSFASNEVEKIGEPVTVDGKTYQQYNFGYLNLETYEIVAELPKTVASFTEGDIVENEGKFAIATDNFSAFISAREGSVKGAVDYRFIIAADIEKFATYSNPNLVLSFVKDGEVVKTATKNVLTDLDIYASATAAGKTYVALEGNLLFGLVVTDVPAEAWDTVTVTLAEGEEAFVTGSVAAADVVVDPLPGKLLGGGTWNPYTENDSATGKPVFVIWFHDNVGGANLVSKVSDGTYDATLTINGKEYSEFVTNPAGRYLVIFLEDSGIYGIKNGEKYTISFVAYDENGTRLVYSNPWEITSKVETADGPVYDYTNAIDLIAAGASSIAIEDHHSVHDKNLALAFRLADKTAWAALFGAGTPVSENGNWTPNEGYTVVVTINGEPTTFNRFSYYGFKTDNVVTDGYFRFELGAFDALTTNGISCSLAITFALIDANNKVVVYGDFGTLKYGTLVYEADTDNPGKDALVTTVISGPDFDGGEGAKMLFDNKTTSKLCTSDRTPVIFSLAEAKALGGISLVTANDNKAYGGRIVPGFTLYGANSADATEWTTVLAVTDAGMSGVDFTEFYYAIENATAFSHYKLVFDGTDLFQFSEMWVYEK